MNEDRVYEILDECITRYNTYFKGYPWESMIWVRMDMEGLNAGSASLECKDGIYTATIRLNPEVMDLNPNEFNEDTVRHEIAHIFTDYLRYKKYFLWSIKPHGSEWKILARLCGCSCITAASNYKAFRKSQPRPWKYVCANILCDVTLNVNNKDHVRYQGGKPKMCRKCGFQLRYKGGC